tara:strand:- start:150 stop:302 length:153 start_codon:yes stop_codon:yes gene_type:complete
LITIAGTDLIYPALASHKVYEGTILMRSILYLIGLIVVVLAILRFAFGVI